MTTRLALLVAWGAVTCGGCRSSGDEATAGGKTPRPVFQTGIASFYSDALAGRPTASGEPYDPSADTCAHRELPFGTAVEVERLGTAARAQCRVNDRGPFHEDRVIDLSRSVAERLEIDGIAKVALRVVSRPEEKRSGE